MKPVLIILLVLATTGATAQRPTLLRERIQQESVLNRWKALRITPEQRIRILALMRRRQVQESQNQKELNEILTDEQKKQLNAWKRQPAPKDSTTNNP